MNPTKPDPNNPSDAAPLRVESLARVKGTSRGERWFRSLVQYSSDVVMILEADGTVRYVSPAVERVLGYRPEDFAGTLALDYVHPEDIGYMSKSFAETLEKPGVQPPIEYRVRTADGSWRYMEAVRSNWLDDPHIAGVVANVRDITERRKAEEALKEGEERYRTLVESVPAVTYTDRAIGSYPDIAVYTSPQIEALVGYSVEEWLDPERDLWEERLHPEDRAWVLAADERSKATGEPFAEEYRLIAKDGRVVWVRDEAALMRGERGEPLYWQGVLIDVTDRKEAEEALKQSEERFRVLTQNSSDIVTLLTADGTIHYQSPSAERILGYRPEEMVGDNTFHYVHPEDLGRVEMAFAEGLKDPRRRPSAEYRFRHKDGSWVWLESVGTNLLDDPGVGEYVVNSRDVTQRKEAEEAIERLSRQSQLILDSAGEGIYGLDREGRTTFVNPAAVALTGFGAKELIGKDQHDFIHHSRSDGTFYPREECPIITGLTDGEVHHVDDEVFWRKDGTSFPVEYTSTPIREDGEIIGAVVTFTDITERKLMEERLQHQAFHDLLTDLPNRHLLMDRLDQALGRTRREKGHQVAVLLMDLDDFKAVNDSLGHKVGDLLLVIVAERLRRCLRLEDTLVRFGGDEFVVVLEGVEGAGDAARVAERMIGTLGEPFVLDGRELFIKPSIGIALGTSRTKSPEELLRDADTAMYQAKDESLGYQVFDTTMHERAVRRLELENDLRRAIEREEFRLLYQPKVRLAEVDKIAEIEALLRWEHPQTGLMLPDEFIPLAEKTGLIVPIGRWVLKEVCRQVKEWQERYPTAPPLVACVNLSASQIRRPGLLRDVSSALEESGIEARSLALEITESALVKDMETSVVLLKELRGLGVRFALDDFGSEYSSLSHLRRLPVDFVKVDKSFVWGLGKDPREAIIVEAIISLAHSLGLEVVGEGVETSEQLEYLRSMGCDLAQGYHLVRPLPSEEIDLLLEKRLTPLDPSRSS